MKARTVDALLKKIELLERRITLLERAAARNAGQRDAPEPTVAVLSAPKEISVDDPGIVYGGAHKLEKNDAGESCIWLGGAGAIQLVLPPSAVSKANCHLLLAPHPAVKIEKMSVLVNDQPTQHKFQRGLFRKPSLSFEIEDTGTAPINIVIAGVESVRPSDLGQNADKRLLAFQFFGCRIVPQASAPEQAIGA